MIGVLIDAIADIRFRETFLFVFPACDLKGFLTSRWDFLDLNFEIKSYKVPQVLLICIIYVEQNGFS